MNVINTYDLHIKSWCPVIEETAEKQIFNLSKLPFAFHHIVVLPDSHSGYGMPIGSVLATKGIIIPNAVGIDISCGVHSVKTYLKEIDIEILKKIMFDVRKQIPVGFNHRKESMKEKMPIIGGYAGNTMTDICMREYQSACHQLGTLGGGNHFIEFQKGSDGHIWFMIHSGSRNLGKQVCDHYNKLAKKINEKYFSSVPKEFDLAFFPLDSEEGQSYYCEMMYCLDFAKASRQLMADDIKHIIHNYIGNNLDFPANQFTLEEYDIHHNYCVMENHCATCIDNQGNDNQIIESLLGVAEVSKARDFLNGYRPVLHSCGGLILSNATSFLKISPSQVYVLEQMRDAIRSLNLGLELKRNPVMSFLHLCECVDHVPFDASYYNSLSKFGLGFSHLFGVEKDFHKWDRILGRIFLGFLAYDLDCKLSDTHIIAQKHNKSQVLVHRKGATRAYKDEICLIPGSQGTKSYIAKGLGNPNSFMSCSHGAGRKMSRTKAEQTLNLAEQIEILDKQGIIHGIRGAKDLDEAPGAYKSIDEVMENQKDLTTPIVELSPIGVIKA